MFDSVNVLKASFCLLFSYFFEQNVCELQNNIIHLQAIKKRKNMLNYVYASFYYFYLYFTNTCEAEVCVP